MEVEELQQEMFSPFSRNQEHAALWDPVGWGMASLWGVALLACNSLSPRWDCPRSLIPLCPVTSSHGYSNPRARPPVPPFFTTSHGLQSVSQRHLTSRRSALARAQLDVMLPTGWGKAGTSPLNPLGTPLQL